ncbi:MAG: DUF642 domain-containing protein [Pseudomonadota bacterium]
MCKKLLLTMLALVFITASQAQANLLTNGDFDTDPGPLNNGNWGFFDEIPGWQKENIFENIELQTEATLGVTPHSGRFYAELNSHPAQAPSFSWGQSFDTQAGMVYKVVFWHRSRTGDDGSFKVEAGDYSNAGILNSDNTQWSMFMFTFTADDITETLQFTSNDPGSDTIGHLIDTVSVTKVPVPAAVWLFGTALAGLFTARSRKAKS